MAVDATKTSSILISYNQY